MSRAITWKFLMNLTCASWRKNFGHASIAYSLGPQPKRWPNPRMCRSNPPLSWDDRHSLYNREHPLHNRGDSTCAHHGADEARLLIERTETNSDQETSVGYCATAMVKTPESGFPSRGL